MKKVSVIIPTYNEENTIEACLDSLSKQTYKDTELIVVDDGSTDKTLKVLSEFSILKQNHKGPGEARNLGASHANGDILVFVDADMTFDEDFVKKLIAPIIDGKAKGTFSQEEYVANWDNVWSRCWNINEGWEKKRRHTKSYPTTQKVFRAILKSEFDRVGGFDVGGHYNDDWSLSEKLGYEAVAAHTAVFYHENPAILSEVFYQAKWSAKRKYKLGIIGNVGALIRVLLPVSLVVGFIKSLIYATPQFIVFKVVYDLGYFLGILQYIFTGRGAK